MGSSVMRELKWVGTNQLLLNVAMTKTVTLREEKYFLQFLWILRIDVDGVEEYKYLGAHRQEDELEGQHQQDPFMEMDILWQLQLAHPQVTLPVVCLLNNLLK